MTQIDLSKTQDYLEWLKEKLYLNSIAPNASKRKVYRGQVYLCKLGQGIGSEENKERPCVVIQCDGGNINSPNTIVAPITHSSSNLSTVVQIANKFDSSGNKILDGFVLLGNITCVSKARLGNYVVDLNKIEMEQVDNSIAISLGIKHHYTTIVNLYNDKLKYIDILKRQIQSLKSI